MTRSNRLRLKDALRALQEAEHDMWDALKREYPLKAPIKWLVRGVSVQSGFVVKHGFGDRIKVCNERSGSSPWIHAYQIICEPSA